MTTSVSCLHCKFNNSINFHRCVAEEQRSLALGLQSFFFRIVGNVPGPIVFGAVFDAACIYFRYDVPCMSRGNCWVYDNFQLSWSILAIALIAICINLVFSFLTWLTYPKHVPDKTAFTNMAALELSTDEALTKSAAAEPEKSS